MVWRRPRAHSWRPVPGIRTITTPCPIASRDELHLLALDQDRRLVWNRLRPREGWAEWREIPPDSALWQEEALWKLKREDRPPLSEIGPVSAPTLPVAWNDRLYLLLVDKEGRVQYAIQGPDGQWSSPQAVPGAPRTRLAPSAVAGRSALLVAVTSEGGRVYLGRQGRLSGWHPWRTLSGEGFAAYAPALCPFDGRIHVFAVSADGLVYQSTTR